MVLHVNALGYLKTILDSWFRSVAKYCWPLSRLNRMLIFKGKEAHAGQEKVGIKSILADIRQLHRAVVNSAPKFI